MKNIFFSLFYLSAMYINLSLNCQQIFLFYVSFFYIIRLDLINKNSIFDLY
jgi:hypothetical protein